MRWIGRALSTVVLLGILAVMWPTTLGGATAYVKVSGRSMLPKLQDGDLVVTRAVDHHGPGDVIAYRVPPVRSVPGNSSSIGSSADRRGMGSAPAATTVPPTISGDPKTPTSWVRSGSSLLMPGRRWESFAVPIVLAAFAAALAVSAAVALVGHTRSEGEPLALDDEEPEPQVILVVDDQLTFRRGVARMLSDSGYTVREADDGCSVLVAARADPLPALVLCDIAMPGMSGPDVLMSGRAPDLSRDPSRPFLREPFLESELLELVRHELEDAPVGAGAG